jgi:hypothetical protein
VPSTKFSVVVIFYITTVQYQNQEPDIYNLIQSSPALHTYIWFEFHSILSLVILHIINTKIKTQNHSITTKISFLLLLHSQTHLYTTPHLYTLAVTSLSFIAKILSFIEGYIKGTTYYICFENFWLVHDVLDSHPSFCI